MYILKLIEVKQLRKRKAVLHAIEGRPTWNAWSMKP